MENLLLLDVERLLTKIKERTAHKTKRVVILIPYFILYYRTKFNKSSSLTAVRKNILLKFVICAFIAIRSHEKTSRFPSIYSKYNIDRYGFIQAYITY